MNKTGILSACSAGRENHVAREHGNITILRRTGNLKTVIQLTDLSHAPETAMPWGPNTNRDKDSVRRICP